MANVLPPKSRVALKHNYLLRLVITGSIVLTGSMVIGIVSLTPAYLLARGELQEIERYQEIQDEARKAAKQDTAVATARYVRASIEEVEALERVRASRAFELVLRDWERHANDIIITSVLFLIPEGKDPKPEVRISGEARDRATLNTFVQTLRRDSAFASVELPVSDLVNSEETKFSVVVVLKEE